MTFDEITQAVGTNVLIYDSGTAAWLTGREVNQTDVKAFVNQIYRDELFPMFGSQYPTDFKQTGVLDSWIAYGTANSGLTTTTLTMASWTSGEFTNNQAVLGLTLWNDTDSAMAKITSFNSSTSVTTDTDMTSWSGDTIYVLGQEFTMQGDATDFFRFLDVAVKYETSDTYYKVAQQTTYNDFYQEGSEIAIQLSPFWYPMSLNVSGVLKKGFGILPPFKSKVSNALKVGYVAKPPALSAGSDTPIIPVDIPLIYGATSRALRLMGGTKQEEADDWNRLYLKSKQEAIANYTPTNTGNRPVRPKMPRRMGAIARHLT